MHLRIILNIPLFMLAVLHQRNDLQVTQLDLHRHFHALGAGVIEEMLTQRDKGFGFVRYSTHTQDALAIQLGNTQSLICGRPIKCSWGSKPTPMGTRSNPPPPPAVAPFGVLTPADLLAYERQLVMSKIGGSTILCTHRANIFLTSRELWAWVLLGLPKHSMMVAFKIPQLPSSTCSTNDK